MYFVYHFKKPGFSFLDLFYCLFSLYFTYFYSNLCFFLLSTFGLFCSSFSRSLRYKVSLRSFFFLNVGIYSYELPSELSLLHLVNFGVLYFHFNLPRYFLVSVLISSLAHWLFSSMLFNLNIFLNFLVFFL